MKKIILPIALILLVGLSVWVYASALDVEITVKQGWNIIAGTIPQDGLSANSEIKLEDIEAMWYYSPLQKKYIMVHPNTDWTALQKDDDDFVLTNAMWIYSKKAGVMRYSTLEDYPQLSDRQLYSGWNFVTITPNFAGYSLNQLKGSCDILEVYAFENNQWENLINDVNENKKFGRMSSMHGLVIKVSNDCNLGSAGGNGITPPPSLPNGPSTQTCIDSDGGKDYYTKGTTSGYDPTHGFHQATDECTTAPYTGEIQIAEHYCNPSINNDVWVEHVSCPSGHTCQDGACI